MYPRRKRSHLSRGWNLQFVVIQPEGWKVTSAFGLATFWFKSGDESTRNETYSLFMSMRFSCSFLIPRFSFLPPAFRTFREFQNSLFQVCKLQLRPALRSKMRARLYSVKHKPIFDTAVNNLKWKTLLALGQSRPTQLGFLLSVRGHGRWLGKISHLLIWSWHDSLALDKIKDGPLEHFWWVIACMQSTHIVDKVPKEIQIVVIWWRVIAYRNQLLSSGLY